MRSRSSSVRNRLTISWEHKPMLAPNLEGTSGEPFDLGRDFGQLLKLRNGQGPDAGGEGEAAGGDNQFFTHSTNPP
jgi:hypothetical protein